MPQSPPSPPEHSGFGVRLDLARAEDGAVLYSISPAETFRYFLSWPGGPGRVYDRGGFETWFDAYRSTPSTRCFVVRDAATGDVLGCTSFLDIDRANRAVEIGGTWYAPAARGSHVNPACKFFLLGHAFAAMWPADDAEARTSSPGSPTACVRVTLKCDARNDQSQRAIEKLGAVLEGTLRKHRVQPDGFTRDTVYFSVLAEEWPRVRAGLLERLGARA